jgi:hypothetical protein
MEWRHSGSSRSKKSLVLKSAWEFLASIYWDQAGILLIYYLPKDQTINAEYYTSLLVQLTYILKEKCRGAGSSPWWSCSCSTMLRLTGHLQPKRKWTTYTSNALITHPILRIWPRPTTTSSLDWKTIELSPILVRCVGHCCRGDLVGRTTFWFFFEWLANVLTKGLKRIWSFVGIMLNKSPVGRCTIFSFWSS